MKKQLYPFQINAIAHLIHHDRVLFGLDMGLGKTFTSLNWLKQKFAINNQNHPTLIICQANKWADWVHEVQNVFPNSHLIKQPILQKTKIKNHNDQGSYDYRIIVVETIKQLEQLVKNSRNQQNSQPWLLIDGQFQKWIAQPLIEQLNQLQVEFNQALKHWIIDQKTFVIVSYAIFSQFSKNHRYWTKWFGKWAIIFDESQGLRNHQSQISLAMHYEQYYCQYLALLSGDPVPNGYQDWYRQMELLGLTKDSYWKWRQKYLNIKETYAHYVGKKISIIDPKTPVLQQQKDEIDQLLTKQVYLLKTDQAIGLPQQNFIEHRLTNEVQLWFADLDDVQQIFTNDYYEQMLNDGFLTINEQAAQVVQKVVLNYSDQEIASIKSAKVQLGIKNVDLVPEVIKMKLKQQGLIRLGAWYWINSEQSAKREDQFLDDAWANANATLYHPDGSISVLAPAVLSTYLREISSGFIKQPGSDYVVGLHEDKINQLVEILNEINHEERVVIFYNFQYDLKMIMGAKGLAGRQFVQINGQVNNFDNQKDYPPGTLFCIQYQSGAKGIEGLQKYSNRMIYYNPTYSAEMWAQSQKRIHRLGQENHCFYHLLISSPIEAFMYQKLAQKEDVSQKMFAKFLKQQKQGL